VLYLLGDRACDRDRLSKRRDVFGMVLRPMFPPVCPPGLPFYLAVSGLFVY
jgi:hypothetical protein